MKYCMSCKNSDINGCNLGIPNNEIESMWSGCKFHDSINEFENLRPNTNKFCKDCKYYNYIFSVCKNPDNQAYLSKNRPKVHKYMYCQFYKENFVFRIFRIKKFLINLFKEIK